MHDIRIALDTRNELDADSDADACREERFEAH